MPETPGSIAHATTKGAVIGMTRELALEGGPHHIRANSISPGAIETPATAPALADTDFRADSHRPRDARPDRHRRGRRGAGAVPRLATSSSWVTGANFVVDGGFTAR